MESESKKVRILKAYINPISFKFLCEKISGWIKEKKGHYICLSAVHGCIEAYDSEEYAKVYNGVDIFRLNLSHTKIDELEIVKSFTPKKGTVVFFQSTPNSYHGVKRFMEKNCPKRFFIYGSYALNKPVIWNYKGISYYPHIISNKKRMLTSFHDVNYLTTAPKH